MQPISGANCGGRARSFRRRRLLLGLGGLALPRIAPAQEVGEGIKVATVSDPFGNLIGLIENPHFALPKD